MTESFADPIAMRIVTPSNAQERGRRYDLKRACMHSLDDTVERTELDKRNRDLNWLATGEAHRGRAYLDTHHGWETARDFFAECANLTVRQQ